MKPRRKKPSQPKAQGTKYDHNKPMVDLIPMEAIFGLGEVLAFGAKKYNKANWSKGILYSRLIAATIRHVFKFANGEDLDEESNLNHIDHAMCNLVFLKWMYAHRKDLDDRWNKIEVSKVSPRTKSPL